MWNFLGAIKVRIYRSSKIKAAVHGTPSTHGHAPLGVGLTHAFGMEISSIKQFLNVNSFIKSDNVA